MENDNNLHPALTLSSIILLTITIIVGIQTGRVPYINLPEERDPNDLILPPSSLRPGNLDHTNRIR